VSCCAPARQTPADVASRRIRIACAPRRSANQQRLVCLHTLAPVVGENVRYHLAASGNMKRTRYDTTVCRHTGDKVIAVLSRMASRRRTTDWIRKVLADSEDLETNVVKSPSHRALCSWQLMRVAVHARRLGSSAQLARLRAIHRRSDEAENSARMIGRSRHGEIAARCGAFAPRGPPRDNNNLSAQSIPHRHLQHYRSNLGAIIKQQNRACYQSTAHPDRESCIMMWKR